MVDTFRLYPLKLNTRTLPAITPSKGFLQTTERRQSLRLLAPILRPILRSCRLSSAPPLLTRGTRSWTRNIRSSRTSWSRSKLRNDRNFSRRRTRNISSWRNKRLIRRERSNWSKNTSNRHSNWSKNTRSRPSRWCRDSSRLVAANLVAVVVAAEVAAGGSNPSLVTRVLALSAAEATAQLREEGGQARANTALQCASFALVWEPVAQPS